MAAAMSGKVVAMRCARAWGTESVLVANKGLEAKGRDDGGFIALFLSRATSVAEAFLFVLPLDHWPEPAACA